MKAPSTITKICQRCEKPFAIPNVRKSPAREHMLMCYPCSHCLYSSCDVGKDGGRCTDCSIPFTIIRHHAKGRCDRDYMKLIRAQRKEV